MMPLAGGMSSIPNMSGGDATSGNGDSTFNNHTKFGGIDYNKGIPQWVIYAAIGLAAFWVISGKR